MSSLTRQLRDLGTRKLILYRTIRVSPDPRPAQIELYDLEQEEAKLKGSVFPAKRPYNFKFL